MSLAVIVLLALLSVAALTDVVWHRVYNWVTYPGILAGLLLNFTERGPPGLEDGVKGFLICGLLMLVCFVFFPTGGGDVKLIAMMGACLGVERGVESMLWTFIIGGVIGVGLLIWRVGLFNLFLLAVRQIRLVWKARSWISPPDADRVEFQRSLYLAPSGLLAACLVLADHRWELFSRG